VRTSNWIFAVSVVAHGAIGIGIGSLRASVNPRMATAISVAEAKKKPPPPKSETPPPPLKAPEPSPLRHAAKAKAAEAKPLPDAPAKANANQAAMDALPDFGLSLSGGVGSGGLAVPGGDGLSGGRAAAAAPLAAKAAPVAPKPVVDDCSEAIVKPKPENVPQPSYTPAAREANVQGKVRVEVSIDAGGHVSTARLLAGLGYGLDEAALAAARSATFTPATKCGRPTATTFVIAMRFSL
jgi:periplasmic protein TonB